MRVAVYGRACSVSRPGKRSDGSFTVDGFGYRRTTPAGSSTHSNGVFTINAGGTDIWNTSDQFRFIYQEISGDGEIMARVDSLTTADP